VGGMSGSEAADAAGATAASATGAAGPSLGSSLRVQCVQATQQFLIKCATCPLSGTAYHMQMILACSPLVQMLEHDLKADTYDNAKHAVLFFMQSSSQMYCYMCRPARKGSADLKDHDT
jgi:hypothetical protein